MKTMESGISESTYSFFVSLVNKCADEHQFDDTCDCWKCPLARKCLDVWDTVVVDYDGSIPSLHRIYAKRAIDALQEVFDEKHKMS